MYTSLFLCIFVCAYRNIQICICTFCLLYIYIYIHYTHIYIIFICVHACVIYLVFPIWRMFMKDSVLSYIQQLFEAQLGGQGFALRELAVLAATLEHLVNNEARERLQGGRPPLRSRISHIIYKYI